jgi:hypothetical protein
MLLLTSYGPHPLTVIRSVPTNAQKHSIEDNIDIVAGNNSHFVFGILSSDLCYSEQRLAASVWTVIGDDVLCTH